MPLWNRFGIHALAALVIAAVANAIVYFIASSLGAMPETVLVQPAEMPITLVPVVSLTMIAAVAGTIVYGALLRFTKQPARIFTIMAVVVLLVAIVPTFGLGAPTDMVIALNVMHFVAGGIIVAVLTRVQPE
jgi:hypothetical protein